MTQPKYLIFTPFRSPRKLPNRDGDIVDKITMRVFGRWLPRLFRQAVLTCLVVIALTFLGIGIFGQPKHGATFSDFARGVASESVEYGAAFTASGDTIFETSVHAKSKVLVPAPFFLFADIVGGGDFIFSHNHPSGDALHSTCDIIMYTETKPIKAIVIGKDCQGVLEAPQGWPNTNEVKAYFAQATELVEATSDSVSYCANKDYIELFNYPEVAEDFLRTFSLVYTQEPIA